MRPSLARALSFPLNPGLPKWDPSPCPSSPVAASTLPSWGRRGTALPGNISRRGSSFPYWECLRGWASLLSYTPKWRGKALPRIGGSSVPYIHMGPLYVPDAGLDIPFAHSFNNAWPGILIFPDFLAPRRFSSCSTLSSCKD